MEGHQFLASKEISDHRSDGTAIAVVADGYIGLLEITYHLIFDMKMDFSRKARTVAD